MLTVPFLLQWGQTPSQIGIRGLVG